TVQEIITFTLTT
nr:immunoglobulin heavy chain junction region [Mus musculus]